MTETGKALTSKEPAAKATATFLIFVKTTSLKE